MNFLVRADASTQIGSGHIMRCLTLAVQLRERGANVVFVCREYKGNLCGLIETHGFCVFRIIDESDFSSLRDAEQTQHIIQVYKLKIDWLIVDHYRIDEQWERKFISLHMKIWVIDDLADRIHDCDVLLDQNLYMNMELRYNDLIPSRCRKLLGPAYSLLRPEFWKARKYRKIRNGHIERIFVFFGSSDPTNETTKVLQVLKKLPLEHVEIDVVVGEMNSNIANIRALCKTMFNTTFHCQINCMADLMNCSDLAIGAGGATTWERACLGLPAVTIAVAKNQLEILETAADLEAIYHLGWHDQVKMDDLSSAIKHLRMNPEILKAMGDKAYQIMGQSSEESFALFIDELMGDRYYA